MTLSRVVGTLVVAGLIANQAPIAAQSWEGPAAVAVQVTSDKGDPIADAEILARTSEGNPNVGPPLGKTDSRGYAVISGLAEGEWFIEVTHPGYMVFAAYIDLKAGKKPQVGFSSQVNTEASFTPMRVKFSKASPTSNRASTTEKRSQRKDPEVVRETPTRAPAEPEVVRPAPQPQPPQPTVVRPETTEEATASAAEAPQAEPSVTESPTPDSSRDAPSDEPAETVVPAADAPQAVETELAAPDTTSFTTPSSEAPVSEVPQAEAAIPEPEAVEPPALKTPPAPEEPLAVDQPPVSDEPPARYDPVAEVTEPETADPATTKVPPTPAEIPIETEETVAEVAPEPETETAVAPTSVTEPPTGEAAAREVPAAEDPVDEAPVAELPTAEAQEAEAALAEAPAAEAPVTETPGAEAQQPTAAVTSPAADPSPAGDAPETAATAEPQPTDESPIPAAPEPVADTSPPEESTAAASDERSSERLSATPPTSSSPAPDSSPTQAARIPRYLRSAAAGSCSECEPGEWAVASEQEAARPGGDGPGFRNCPTEFVAAAEEAARMLADLPAERLDDYAGPVLTAMFRMPPSDARSRLQDLLGPVTDPESYCQLAGVVLPESASFSGYVLEAWDSLGGRACRADISCAVGKARWLDEPIIIEGAERTVVYDIFKNSSTRRERRAKMTIYFRPPAPDWVPASR